MAIIDIPAGRVIATEAVVANSTTVEVGLTAATIAADGRSATKAVLTTSGGAIVFSLDGSDPNTAGHAAAAGDCIILRDIDQLNGFRAVKVTGDVTIAASLIR